MQHLHLVRVLDSYPESDLRYLCQNWTSTRRFQQLSRIPTVISRPKIKAEPKINLHFRCVIVVAVCENFLDSSKVE